MQTNKIRSIIFIFLIILVAACEKKSPKTLPELLEGMWHLTDLSGDIKPEDRNFEMQIEIKPTGELIALVVNKNVNPPKIEKARGRLEGEYIVFDDKGFGKVKYANDQLEINWYERNITLFLKKVSISN